ncbi:hypothetical protein V6N12_008599 [Hibiscus sabdariffa]|uniref:Endonuclease/exonuclease/phosphatase domain-containing protein n=1 Tax=Hibiscus sabdariffa TaxID=183260 RepID=A0ABR2BJE1_9ROSI
MAILAWNVRGLGNKETVRGLKNAIQKFQPEMAFLSETKQQKRYLEKIRMKMKMEQYFYIEPNGIAGGLALWWFKNAKINILKYGKNFIDAEISVDGESKWFGTFIYGPPYKEENREFWEFMSNLRNGSDERWLVIGDSNVVSSQEEKIGGASFNPNNARSYFGFVDTQGLIDLPIAGGSFTWSNQRCEEEAILEKLDRVLCSPDWNSFFPKAVTFLDIAIGSDHSPVIVLLKGFKRKYEDFKFESKWLLKEDCTSTVHDSWISTSQPRNSHRFGSKLRRTKFSLIRWSKLKSRINNQKKLELEKKIKSYQGKQLSKEELTPQNELNLQNKEG